MIGQIKKILPGRMIKMVKKLIGDLIVGLIIDAVIHGIHYLLGII